MRILAALFVVFIVVSLLMPLLMGAKIKETKLSDYLVTGFSVTALCSVIALPIAYGIMVCRITTVYINEDGWQKESHQYGLFFKYEDENHLTKYSFIYSGTGLYNNTSRELVLEPVEYGNHPYDKNEYKSISIPPHTFMRIPEEPFRCFEKLPRIISYKTKGGGHQYIKWVLLEKGQYPQYE